MRACGSAAVVGCLLGTLSSWWEPKLEPCFDLPHTTLYVWSGLQLPRGCGAIHLSMLRMPLRTFRCIIQLPHSCQDWRRLSYKMRLFKLFFHIFFYKTIPNWPFGYPTNLLVSYRLYRGLKRNWTSRFSAKRISSYLSPEHYSNTKSFQWKMVLWL